MAISTHLSIITLNVHGLKVKSLSRVQLFVTPWTVAYQAPPPMGFSRHEYWSGVPFPSPTWTRCSNQTQRVDIYLMEYNAAIKKKKKNKILPSATAWMTWRLFC